MSTPRTAPSTADVATEVNGILAGLGIVTMALFPIALPGLLLALPLVLPLAPLALVAVIGWLLLVLPLRLARKALRRLSTKGRTDAQPAARTAALTASPTRSGTSICG